MREREIEKYLNTQIKKIGGISLKFVSPGQSGVPDRIILFNNKCIFVELKAPRKKPRVLQQSIQARFAKQGFIVQNVDTKEKVDELIKTLINN